VQGETQSTLGEMWQEVYERGGNLSFKIVSGSMSPTIEVGDVVKVSRAQPSEIHLGDIVAFQDGQYVMVHRIIGKSLSNEQIIFRHMGDAGASSRRIPAQNLIGRVSVVKKNGREIFLDKSRYALSNKIQVWKLRLVDNLSRMKRTILGKCLCLVLRPAWRLYRNSILRHL
jgi:signal peptidase I